MEPCDSRHHPHSHCSKLTVPQLQASDTGTYTCRYSKDSQDHITSTYVYVKGKIRKSLWPVQSSFFINYNGTSRNKEKVKAVHLLFVTFHPTCQCEKKLNVMFRSTKKWCVHSHKMSYFFSELIVFLWSGIWQCLFIVKAMCDWWKKGLPQGDCYSAGASGGVCCWTLQTVEWMWRMKWSVSNLIFPQDTRIEKSGKKKLKKCLAERQRREKGVLLYIVFTIYGDSYSLHAGSSNLIYMHSEPQLSVSERERKEVSSLVLLCSFFWRWKGECDYMASPGQWLWFPASATVFLSLLWRVTWRQLLFKWSLSRADLTHFEC